MIQLVEGAPGSGKSFFAVKYLLKFVKFDQLYCEYVLDQNVLVISNIEGLRIKHWTLNFCLGLEDHEKIGAADPDRVREFFTIENFERIMQRTGKKHVILCIDEVHELFPADFKDSGKEVYKFFAYHRHIGLDVILLTQGIESTSRLFNPLLEYIVKALPRSKKIGNAFLYHYVDMQGRKLFQKRVGLDKSVFAAYQSFRNDEVNKPFPVARMWAIIVVTLFVLAGVMFKTAVSGIASRGEVGASESVQLPDQSMPGQQVDNSAPVIDAPGKLLNYQPATERPETYRLGIGPGYYFWDEIEVQGYYKAGDDLMLLIAGNVVQFNLSSFRNLNRERMTVIYRGRPFPDARTTGEVSRKGNDDGGSEPDGSEG